MYATLLPFSRDCQASFINVAITPLSFTYHMCLETVSQFCDPNQYTEFSGQTIRDYNLISYI